MVTRRTMLRGVSSAGVAWGLQSLLPVWARSAATVNAAGLAPQGQKSFDLTIDQTRIAVDGREGHALTVNGTVPAPLLRWREGDEVTMRVTNHLLESTSIHWHGIIVPAAMDGVPGVSYPGIAPGETFVYRFPVRQSGTYWYHSHTGLQEQSGHYGPLVIDPAGPDPVDFDREYVVVLSDWTFEDPKRLFAKLKEMSDYYNYHQRTAGEFFRDVQQHGITSALQLRRMWGRMRMSPTDIADVTGATYTYLVNGHGPEDNWTALFRPGERVRLRIINTSAMTFFNVRIPGLPMTVVQADGQHVKPVQVGEFQIGVAETYDVVVEPDADRAYTLMCESIDRSGYGRATLAPRAGMTAEVPPLRPPPRLSMKDMAMAAEMGGMSGMSGMNDSQGGTGMGAAADNGAPGMKGDMAMAAGASDSAGGMNAKPVTAEDMGQGMKMYPHDHATGPGVASTAMQPTSRLDEPGAGLENVGHRVLVYTDLRSLDRNPDMRPPGREMELHLTGNMERYMWSFDGRKFSEVTEPIRFVGGERLRLTMVNDTMMPHPIHLHGMFFEVENGGGDHKPRKHTIIVKPGEKLSVDISADAIGDWAFHCHLLYHMHAGMFRVVSIRT